MDLLYEPSCKFSHRDYGIMLPISPSRAARIIESLNAAPLDMTAASRKLGLPAGPVLSREDLERVHSKDFIAALYGEGPGGKQSLLEAILSAWELIDEEGCPHRYEPEQATRPLEELFGKVLAQAGGTYLACRLALAAEIGGPGFCYYLGGGLHHARYEGGTGFCLINDIMIAARKIQAEQRAGLIWVVDVDAHKGCGTAELIHFARQRGELHALDGGADLPRIFNLSIHMTRGWPLDEETLAKARPGRAPCIPADVEIPIGAGQEYRYITELESGLRKLEQLSETASPDLVIVVDGADPYEHDGLLSSSLMKLSLDQCIQRDRLIYDRLRNRNIPSAWIMAGGYGEQAWEPTAAFLAAAMTQP
ncbi:MAG: histone deacetylase [Treponema sp.]|nr:histone deacetylase [Treponema sp.]